MLMLLIWVCIPLVTPLTYPNSVLVTVEWVGIPLESEIKAIAAVIAAASTIALLDDCIIRLLFSVVPLLVPPWAIDTVPVRSLAACAPDKVPTVRVLVEGLYVRSASRSAAWFPLLLDDTNSGKKEALVLVAVVATLVALVAVVAEVALVALPDKAPENVVVVNVLVDGLNVKPVAVSRPWLPLLLDATKVGKKVAFVVLVAVVAALVALVAVVAVVALVALPVRLAVMVPAEKLPEESLLTIVEAVLVLTAAFASNSAECTSAAAEPPTDETTVAPWVPVTSPTKEPLKLVAELAVVALPDRLAVMVPAEKSPEESRFTIVSGVFSEVAPVEESTKSVKLIVVLCPMSTCMVNTASLLLVGLTTKSTVLPYCLVNAIINPSYRTLHTLSYLLKLRINRC